jgi:transcription factor E
MKKQKAKKNRAPKAAKKIMKAARRALRSRSSGRKAVRVGVLSAALANAHVRQRLIDVAGENALHVIKGFRKSMSDEELARKTKLKVSDVRVVLNKLHSCGLAKYYRNRDKDSGWYSYVWCFEQERLGAFTKEAMEVGIGEKTFEGDSYCCAACGPESIVGFEAASSVFFKCQYCGGALEFVER